MNTKKLIILGIVFLLTIVGFVGVRPLLGNKQISTDILNSTQSSSGYVIGAARNNSISDVSVCEEGLFYIDSSGVLSFYSFDTEDSYIMCSNSGCKHTGSECLAKTGSHSARVVGYTRFNGYVYYFLDSPDSMSWNLRKIDLENQIVTELISLNSMVEDDEEWLMDSLEAGVVYWNDSVWFCANYINAIDSERILKQLLRIDLNSGKLYPVSEALSSPGLFMSFNQFSDKGVVYSVTSWDIMSMDEYSVAHGSIVSELEYEKYIENCFIDDSLNRHRYYLYDITQNASELILEGNNGTMYYGFYDFSDGYIVYEDQNGTTKEYCISSINNDCEPIQLLPEDGYSLGWFASASISALYDNEYILYLRYKDDKLCNIYKCSVKDGKSTYLFEDDEAVSFRLYAQTSDKLIGLFDESSKYGWIYKKDYEKGNMKEIHKISISRY